ncbi:AtaL-like protein [Xenorhabdus thailandensis]|uniref:AtaL-like protein n=1 Tax=Xenorhabdus thailandensis TaxID=3136255 RepID=UPI0030F46CE7
MTTEIIKKNSHNIVHSDELSRKTLLSWTALIPISKATIQEAYDAAWAALIEKARRPMEYVPSISDVEIVKEYSETSFRRKIIRNGLTIIQDVMADKNSGIVRFEHIDDPDTVAIINRLSIFENTNLLYSMKIETTKAWTVCAYKNSKLFSDQDEYFTRMLKTARATLVDKLKDRGFL